MKKKLIHKFDFLQAGLKCKGEGDNDTEGRKRLRRGGERAAPPT